MLAQWLILCMRYFNTDLPHCRYLRLYKLSQLCCPKEEKCMLHLIYIQHMLFFLWMADNLLDQFYYQLIPFLLMLLA